MLPERRLSFLGLELRDNSLDEFVRPGIRFRCGECRTAGKRLFRVRPKGRLVLLQKPPCLLTSCFLKFLVHSSGLKFCLFAMATSYSLRPPISQDSLA